MLNKDIKFTLQFNKHPVPLSTLSKHHGSDKGSPNLEDSSVSGWKSLNLTDIYHLLFTSIRYSTTKVFECGLGTNNENISSNMSKNGIPKASARMWKDFFPNATIYGADIDPDICVDEERIKTFVVDQTNPISVKDMWNRIAEDNFDIMIDDGEHLFNAAKTLFENSFEKLRPGGFYVIEDLHYGSLREMTDYLNKRNIHHFVFTSRYFPNSSGLSEESYDSLIVIVKNA